MTEAAGGHADRLTEQLVAARPELVVTLGNAAARVLALLGNQPDRSAVLDPEKYGQELHVTVRGQEFRSQALVHPATPRLWSEGHLAWAGVQ